MPSSRQWIYAGKPNAQVGPANFELGETPVPAARPGKPSLDAGCPPTARRWNGARLCPAGAWARSLSRNPGIRMEGFAVMDFCSRRAQAEAALARWLNHGSLKDPWIR